MTEQTGLRMFGWEEVASALFRDQGITEGLWHIGVSLNFAGMTNDWNSVNGTELGSLPTAIVGVSGLGLTRVKAGGGMVFNAATGKSVGHTKTGVLQVEPVLPKASTSGKSSKSRARA